MKIDGIYSVFNRSGNGIDVVCGTDGMTHVVRLTSGGEWNHVTKNLKEGLKTHSFFTRITSACGNEYLCEYIRAKRIVRFHSTINAEYIERPLGNDIFKQVFGLCCLNENIFWTNEAGLLLRANADEGNTIFYNFQDSNISLVNLLTAELCLILDKSASKLLFYNIRSGGITEFPYHLPADIDDYVFQGFVHSYLCGKYIAIHFLGYGIFLMRSEKDDVVQVLGPFGVFTDANETRAYVSRLAYDPRVNKIFYVCEIDVKVRFQSWEKYRRIKCINTIDLRPDNPLDINLFTNDMINHNQAFYKVRTVGLLVPYSDLVMNGDSRLYTFQGEFAAKLETLV